MRFSVRFNNDLEVAAYPELARAAEAAGFDQFWVSDDLFLRSVWVILAAVAQATERIQIGTCIVNPYTMHPAEIAMAAGALDELAGGRVCLGVSAGARDFLEWVGIAPERPLTAVVETVEVLRRLFAGGTAEPHRQARQGSDGPILPRSEGSDLPRSEGSELPRSEGSELPRSEGSDPPRFEERVLPRSDGPSLPRFEGSVPPRFEGPDLPRSEGSVLPRFEGPLLRGWTEEAYLRFATRPIPLYIGAMGPGMLRAIGRVADGGLPLLFPPEHFSTAMGYIRDGLVQAGRSEDAIDVAACIWCSVAADRQAAEDALRDKIAYYGHSLSPLILHELGVERSEFEPIQRALMIDRDVAAARHMVTPAMLRIGVVGNPADLIPRLENLVAMGARHLSFGPPLGPDPLRALELLGREVLPHFVT